MVATAKLDLVEVMDISVILPVLKRFDDAARVYAEYRDRVASSGKSYEFIFVIDGQPDYPVATLEQLQRDGEPIEIIRFGREVGESADRQCTRLNYRH